MEAIVLGFDPTGYTIFVNDPDGDTSFALWMLLNPDKVSEQKVRDMAVAIGRIDAQGPSRGAAEKLHKCLSRNPREVKTREMLEEDLAKVDLWFANGNDALPAPFSLPPAPAYALNIATGEVTELGLAADFTEAYAAGTVALLAPQMPDGSVGYTIGKKSEFVDFPVGPHDIEGTVLNELKKLEEGWGGSSTIGGAPRNEKVDEASGRKVVSRSHLSVEQVLGVMRGFVRATQ